MISSFLDIVPVSGRYTLIYYTNANDFFSFVQYKIKFIVPKILSMIPMAGSRERGQTGALYNRTKQIAIGNAYNNIGLNQ